MHRCSPRSGSVQWQTEVRLCPGTIPWIGYSHSCLSILPFWLNVNPRYRCPRERGRRGWNWGLGVHGSLYRDPSFLQTAISASRAWFRNILSGRGPILFFFFKIPTTGTLTFCAPRPPTRVSPVRMWARSFARVCVGVWHPLGVYAF